MKTIEQKLATVTAAAARLGMTEAEARHLIHATGGSPRRAKRLMRVAPAAAVMLAGNFRTAIESGTPFRTALAAAQAAWPAVAAQHGIATPAATEAPEGGEGDDEADADADADADAEGAALAAAVVAAAKAKPAKGKAKGKAKADAEDAIL